MCTETKKGISLNLLLPDSNKRVKILFFFQESYTGDSGDGAQSLIEAIFIFFI